MNMFYNGSFSHLDLPLGGDPFVGMNLKSYLDKFDIAKVRSSFYTFKYETSIVVPAEAKHGAVL